MSDNKNLSMVEEEVVGYNTMKQPFDPSKIKIRPQPITVDAMVERIRYNEIDLSTKFQRKEGLWNDEQQSRLIESILIRFPLPVFYFDGSNNDRWLIIDGLQRLTSLKRFIITKDLKLTGLEYLKLNGKRWDDLERPHQRQIKETQLHCYILEEGEDNVKFNIFKRINTGGLILSSQEIRHAMHQEVSSFLKELAESKEFLAATKNKIDTDRMLDRDFVNRFIAFYLLDYETEYLKEDDLDTFMNRALNKLSKLTEAERKKIAFKFKESMKFSREVFGDQAFSKQPKPNRINKALFEIVSVHCARLNEHEKDILLRRKETFSSNLYKAIKSEFKDSLSTATGGQSNVILRHKEFNKLIQSILNI